MKELKFSKAFVSANGVFGDSVATYSESEGEIQRIALDNAFEKFLLVDHEKFDKYDFYDFYNVSKIDHLVTDSGISEAAKEKFGQLTDIMTAED